MRGGNPYDPPVSGPADALPACNASVSAIASNADSTRATTIVAT